MASSREKAAAAVRQLATKLPGQMYVLSSTMAAACGGGRTGAGRGVCMADRCPRHRNRTPAGRCRSPASGPGRRAGAPAAEPGTRPPGSCATPPPPAAALGGLAGRWLRPGPAVWLQCAAGLRGAPPEWTRQARGGVERVSRAAAQAIAQACPHLGMLCSIFYRIYQASAPADVPLEAKMCPRAGRKYPRTMAGHLQMVHCDVLIMWKPLRRCESSICAIWAQLPSREDSTGPLYAMSCNY